MKNTHEILKELGIEIPADKKAEFDTAVNENYKTVAEVDKLRTARDTYKQSLEDINPFHFNLSAQFSYTDIRRQNMPSSKKKEDGHFDRERYASYDGCPYY